MKYEVKKLILAYEKFGSIIVGVDFDDTLFPLTEEDYIELRCIDVRATLVDILENGIKMQLCLFTVADRTSLKYKAHIMDMYGLTPSFINESPVMPHGKCAKPYFNILLDDKAGLNESLETLKEFLMGMKKG